MEKIAEKIEWLGAHMTLVVVAILAGMSRTIVSEEQRTIGGYVRAIIVAGFVGFVATQLLDDMNFGEGTKGAIVGVSAFIANDILRALLVIGASLADDPIGTITNLKSIITKGKK